MTTLPQGYTNGVQVFDRVIRKVLSEQIAQGRSSPFVDDVGVRPVTRYLPKRSERLTQWRKREIWEIEASEGQRKAM